MGLVTRLALALGTHQVGGMWQMRQERNRKFAQAEALSDELGKPLLVVGGPWGSRISGGVFGIKAHGCGDTCVDISAQSCAGCPYVEADIRDLPFNTGEFGGAFCAHVLEHMPTALDCFTAWRELHRVADYVYICVPPRSSIFAWMVPDHYLWVWEELESGRLRVQERASRRWYEADLDGNVWELMR